MVMRLVSHLLKEEGQDLIEYGLLGAFIAVISILTVQGIGEPIVSIFFAGIQKALLQ